MLPTSTSLTRTLELLDLMDEAPPAPVSEGQLIQELKDACATQGIVADDARIQHAVKRYLAKQAARVLGPQPACDDTDASPSFTLWHRPANPAAWGNLLLRWREGRAIYRHAMKVITRGLVGAWLGFGVLVATVCSLASDGAWSTVKWVAPLSFLTMLGLTIPLVTWAYPRLSRWWVRHRPEVADALAIARAWTEDGELDSVIRHLDCVTPSADDMRAWLRCPATLTVLQQLAKEKVPLLGLDVVRMRKLYRDWQHDPTHGLAAPVEDWVKVWDEQVGAHVRRPLLLGM